MPIDQISISFDTPVKNQTDLINLNYARNNLSLKIESNIDQPDMVVLTSIKAIKEPILQFSIELAWNKGRLYKQYNVLLDPQNLYTSKKVSSNIQPLKNRSLPRRTGSFESSVKLSKYNHGRYGPVQYGETLSKISKSLSGQLNENYIDLINAIFVKNPTAFIGKDMNKLKQGSILIIPKTENVAITSPTTSNAFIQGNIAAPKLKHAEKIKIVVTDNNNLGLKLTSSISLERLNLNKSSLLESEPIEEQEVIPKSMIIGEGESIPELKNKIAQLENDNTLLEKRLLLLERKIFSSSEKQESTLNLDTDSRLKSIEEEVFKPKTDNSESADELAFDINSPENKDTKKLAGINIWLWIPIITLIIFLIFWAVYFYRSSIADTQLRNMLKNRASHLRETKNNEEFRSNQTTYEPSISSTYTKETDIPKIKTIKTDEDDDEETIKKEPVIDEIKQTGEKVKENNIENPDISFEEDKEKEKTTKKEDNLIDFSSYNDYKSTPTETDEKEHFTENHLLEADDFLDKPSSDYNMFSINSPETVDPVGDDSNEEELSIESISNENEKEEIPEREESPESKKNKALHQAELHIAFEQYDKAEPILADLVATHPDEPDNKIIYAQTLIHLEKSSEAKEIVDHLLSQKIELGLNEEQTTKLEQLSLELFDTPV